MKRPRMTVLLAAVLAAGCVTFPNGPSVMALPGTNRSFDEFRADDNECRNFAAYSAGGPSAQQASMDAGAASAVLATIIGAAAGAAIGGDSTGAAIGAGTGLLIGSATGSSAAAASGYNVQQRYDIGYTQCMYAKGHQVPVAGSFTSRAAPRRYAPPPAPGTYSPPPASGTYSSPPASGAYSPPPAPGTYAPPPAPGTGSPQPR